MRAYPVTLTQDGKFVKVNFPDIPEALTQGKDREEALVMAKEALELAMEFYFEDRRPVPEPSKAKRGQAVIELSASLSAKVLLLNEMLRQKVRPVELARRLQTSPQEVNRLTNIRHTSRIDGIAGALKALGKTMEIRAV
ncbi:MAG TPA: type II toxin-antitoxin system HicB family antitoxin [Terracidiphilus sp.]|jgi:antitoxin HicB